MQWDTVKGNWKQYGNRLAGMVRQADGTGKEKAERQIRSVENRSID